MKKDIEDQQRTQALLPVDDPQHEPWLVRLRPLLNGDDRPEETDRLRVVGDIRQPRRDVFEQPIDVAPVPSVGPLVSRYSTSPTISDQELIDRK
ncbi:hypothetical protein D3C75_1075740 [compost metagenome]